MNLKKLKIPLVILLLFIIAAGIIYIPKVKNALAMREAMKMKNIEYTFIHMDKNLPTKIVKKANHPFIFPHIKNRPFPTNFVYNGTTYNTLKFIDSSNTQGFLFIKNDTIQYENYWRGQKEDIQHISWSMSKSYISALFGIAIEEGYIKSIHQTVDEYLPELKGSGYDGVKIKDVLQMASGIKFNETYSDPKSDINRYWDGFIYGKSQDKFASTLLNEKPPGTYNHYVSINTHVLGMIIVKATNTSLTNYLHEKIWKPIGAEFDAYWLTDGEGMEMALGGLNACLRDYAKLGRLYLNKGNWNGTQIVPAAWIEQSTSIKEEHLSPQSKNSAHTGMGYGYQWWIPEGEEGEVLAIGVFNQHIYINPTTNTIIVKNSANKNYYDANNPYASTKTHLELYRKLAHGKE
ncbi:serine hydrolase [Mariniflexile litorale]|uniref:Serine hydrolase n=1 Tax=Mariniflexile litorale TaxID=3045158 RepID=A0AAU7EDJ2_9FLAO|nr:serine hydrolase [Mariniflexile sp. KMM 9835]MDQ8212457.1 serine hydrolase [Mariniflexile sp. KMM 9835]